MILSTHGIVGSQMASASFLLDAYPSAAAAYSLRKLRSAYTGSAIRVRRSSDNTEQDIGFTSSGNLNTTSLTTFCSGGEGFITTWYDQSGNAKNATQTTASNQPLIVFAGSVINVNSKPSIDFGLTSASYFLQVPTATLTATNLLSYFHVAKVNTFTNSNAGVFAPTSTNSVGIEILQHDVISTPSLLRLNGVAKNTTTNNLWTNNAQGMFSFVTNATDTKAYKNNSNVTLANNSAMGNLSYTGIYAIGRYAGPNYMSGNFQELIIYQIDQNSNLTGIQNNINSYYAIY